MTLAQEEFAETQTIDASKAPTASQVSFKGITVDRLVVHRIYERKSETEVVHPKLATALTSLNDESRVALQKRITKALGSRSHGIEMSIDEYGPKSFFIQAVKLFGSSDADFVRVVGALAEDVSKAQASTSASAGVLAAVDGTFSGSGQRFICVIKADIHDGFSATESDTSIDVSYLSQLLLTPSQKLFKIAMLLEIEALAVDADRESVGNFRAFLFDHLLTSTEVGNAAQYFYQTFLGMGIQKSAKKLTQDFYEKTVQFIESAQVNVDTKREMREALRVELRSTSPTINAEEFAKKNFPAEQVATFRKFLDAAGFPANSVPKDTQYVKTKLRARRIAFSNGVRITAPADASADAVTVLGEVNGMTVVQIKGEVSETN